GARLALGAAAGRTTGDAGTGRASRAVGRRASFGSEPLSRRDRAAAGEPGRDDPPHAHRSIAATGKPRRAEPADRGARQGHRLPAGPAPGAEGARTIWRAPSGA